LGLAENCFVNALILLTGLVELFLTGADYSMSHSIPLTKESFEALQEELKRLVREERPKVIQDISEARDHGDLSENAEYDAAKNRQGFIEADIKLGKISCTSPVGKALIGHRLDDSVKVIVPSGKKEYEIIDIKYE